MAKLLVVHQSGLRSSACADAVEEPNPFGCDGL